MTGTNNLITLDVNTENHTNGWTFSLPSGLNDNDLFQIGAGADASKVQCKTATTYYVRPYTASVLATKSGAPSRQKSYVFSVSGQGAKITTAAPISSTYISFTPITYPSSSASSISVSFYIPSANTFYRYGILSDTISAGAPTLGITVNANGTTSVDWQIWTGTVTSAASTGGAITTLSPGWHTCKLEYVTSPSPAINIYFDYVLKHNTTNNNQFPLGLSKSFSHSSSAGYTVAVDGNGSTTCPAGIIIANLVYIYNGTTLIDSSMISGVSGGTSTGSWTFGQTS